MNRDSVSSLAMNVNNLLLGAPVQDRRKLQERWIDVDCAQNVISQHV
jgi:hypothetical protein